MKGLSPRAQRLIVALAQDEGRKSGANELLPEHVLLALLKSADGLGYVLLQQLRINVLTFQLSLEQSLPQPRSSSSDFSDLPPSRRLRTLLDVATVESRSLRNDYVGTEHLLIASIREEQSVSWRFFQRSGITLDQVRQHITGIQGQYLTSAAEQHSKNLSNMMNNLFPAGADGTRPTGPNPRQEKQAKSFLAEFSRDLTQLAKDGKIDPVVGRSEEILRVIQILSRRTKNNPVLLGEPGVGKTAVVEGLAQHIARGEVPHSLLKKRILSLDFTALIAGTKYRGEFEERMKRLMQEVKSDKNIILFIDEIHTIIGAGSPEGTLDASNILKPALSRGELQIIGATTTKEYRQHLEKDAALARRFQSVRVEEPSIEDSIAILEGLKSQYEDFHGVAYDGDVIPAIVKLSKRYVTERFLPDKAIDILDETGAAKKIQEEERPEQLAELEQKIEELSNEKTQLVAEQDYEKAAMVRDKVHELKAKLDEFSEYWRNNRGGDKKRVNVNDARAVISRMTGVPLEQMSESETKKLLHMEEDLHRSIVGQDEAVAVLSKTIRRSRSGISTGKRPVGSFIFLGPTGVGKTELAKALAKFMFGSEDALIRIDMSDFMEHWESTRLVGSAPGYVNSEQGGVLTNQVREKPYSIVLFDELEKAHPSIFNMLLQILEEGELKDGLGHTINFRNTIIIMTSNAGSNQILAENRLGFSSLAKEGVLPYEEIRSNAMEELKKVMKPELLNRVDEIVVFDALDREQVSQILDLQLQDLQLRLAEKSIRLSLKPKAREYLLDKGYDPSMGARPMRRLIQKEIEDPLSILVLQRDAQEEDNPDIQDAVVDCTNGELKVKFAKPRTKKIEAPKIKALIE